MGIFGNSREAIRDMQATMLKFQHLGEFSTSENLEGGLPHKPKVSKTPPYPHTTRWWGVSSTSGLGNTCLDILYSLINFTYSVFSHNCFVVDIRDTNRLEQNNLDIIQTKGSSRLLTLISWPWLAARLFQTWNWWGHTTSEMSQVYHRKS